MAGWTISASGNAEDPAAHESLFERLKELLSDGLFGTGSSTFSSAHKTDTNFHTAPESATATSEGQPAADTPSSGAGAPADTGPSAGAS